MSYIRTKCRCKKYSQGFTLNEIIVVISIIVILSAIAVSVLVGYIEKAKNEVCNSNRTQLKRLYKSYLTIEDKLHTEGHFTKYLNEFGQAICPSNGEVSYESNNVHCSVHSNDDSESDDGDGSVPFL